MFGVDSEEETLAEIYGMTAFAYEGMYIGIPHIYNALHSEYNAKYDGGRIDCTLAYSYDGEYWRKGLREFFISGGEECPIVWLHSMICREEDILLYGSASEHIHGPAFITPGRGRMFVYRLRKDGFTLLESVDDTTPMRIITREKIWKGGELHLNVRGREVRVGVYETREESEEKSNVLGTVTPIEGYSLEDCIPFSGDSTDHIPTFKNGRTLSELVGKTLVFEVQVRDGALASLSGDCVDVYNTEACRYRKFGVFPKR